MTKIDWNPDDAKLRQFGFIAVIGFTIAGSFIFWQHSQTVGQVLWGLAILSPLFSLVYPKANKPTYWALHGIGFAIGMIISTIALGAVFYLIFTPIALVFRLRGRDRLQRKLDRNAASYWIKRPPPRPPADYFRQF